MKNFLISEEQQPSSNSAATKQQPHNNSAATAQQPSSNQAATAQYQHNNLNKWWLLMVFFFVLFAVGGEQKVLGQTNLSRYDLGNVTPNTADPTLPYRIYDDFGNTYSLDQISRPPNKPVTNCANTGGSFDTEIDFLDEPGVGFNNTNMAPARNIICQVLTDISYMVAASYSCEGTKPVLRVQVNPAVFQAPAPSGAVMLGSASGYYYNYSNGTNTQPGYTHNNVWRLINGGNDPTLSPYVNGNNVYHGRMTFNLHPGVNWNYDISWANQAFGNGAQYDFYQVVLHECLHMMGLQSWMNSNGLSSYSAPATPPYGLYTRFDKYLTTAAIPNNNLLTNTNNCYNVLFNANNSLLTGGCQQVTFKGQQNTSLSLPIYTPTAWSDVSSLSHFGDVDNCGTSNYLMHWYILNNATGRAIRYPTDDEASVLCEMGYLITGNYGDGGQWYHLNNELVNCGHIAAGNDDFGAINCSQGMYEFCSLPVTINLADLLANDHNINIAATLADPCLSAVQGNLAYTLNAGVITITNADYGQNILSYIPIDATTGEACNTTFVFFSVTNCNCTDPSDCNLICNSDMYDPDNANCNVGQLLGIGNCSTFDGWATAFGTPDYWINTITADGGGASTTHVGYMTNPPTPGCIGVITGNNITGSEILGESVIVSSGQKYICSVDRMYPDWWTGAGYNLSLFARLSTGAFNSAGTQDILPETNIPHDGQWKQSIGCFTANDNYTRLYLSAKDADFKYFFMDEAYLSPDNFPEPTLAQPIPIIELTAPDCQSLTLGSCLNIPNVKFFWESSLNEGLTYTPITNYALNIATQGTYQTPPISMGNNVWYRVTRYLDVTTPNVPAANQAAAQACINRTAIYKVYSDNYLQFNPITQAIVPFNTPNSTPNYTAPAVTATITPASANNPFGMGVGTVANPVRLNGDLTIPKNANITFSGMNFVFGPSGRIMVAKGTNATNVAGKLTLNNCYLNGDPTCQTMWQGIRVQGAGIGTQQDLYVTGVVTLNNTRVDNAVIGVATTATNLFDVVAISNNLGLLTSDPNNPNLPTNNWVDPLTLQILPNLNTTANSGGHVAANNSQFINCFYGIYFAPFTSTVSPLFAQQNTLFTCNFASSASLWYPFNNTPIPTTTDGGIVANNYKKKIVAEKCQFTNLTYGIRTHKTKQLRVLGNNFTSCERAISNSNPAAPVDYTAQISDNIINACTIGIQTQGVSANIFNNTITGDNNPATYDIGILAQGGVFFMGTNDPLSANGNVLINLNAGALITESDEEANELRKNTFDNCTIATFIVGPNPNLTITCNLLNNFEKGIALTQWPNLAPGQLEDQGSCDPLNFHPAENIFSNFDPTTNYCVWRDLAPNASLLYHYNAIDISNITTNDPNIPQECQTVPIDYSIETECGNMPTLSSPAYIAALSNAKQQNTAMQRLLRQYQADSNYTAAIALLETVDNRLAKRKLVEQYYNNEQLSQANTKLESIERQTTEDEQFYTLQKMLISLKETNTELHDISPDQEATLLNIAQSHTNTAFKAQSVLHIAKGYNFPVILPQMPTNSGNVFGYTVFKHNTNSLLPLVTALQPNPTNNAAQLSYHLPDQQSATLLLYDINGRLISSNTFSGNGTYTLNTNELTNGVYFYTVQSNHNVLMHNKLVIIK